MSEGGVEIWRRVREARFKAQQAGQRLDATEAAAVIAEAGARPVDAVDMLLEAASPFSWTPGRSFKETGKFLVGLLRDGSGVRIAEHASTPAFLSPAVIEGHPEAVLDIYSLSIEVAEAISTVLRPFAPGESEAARLPEIRSEYDLVILQTPFGAGPDRFGVDMVAHFAEALSPKGVLAWITFPSVNFDKKVQQALANLDASGVHLNARIDLAPGAVFGSKIPGALLLFEREATKQVFVARIDRPYSGDDTANAFWTRAYKKHGPDYTWLERTDHASFADLEARKAKQRLRPKGSGPLVKLGDLLTGDISRADKPVDQSHSVLFLPAYAQSRATTTLEDQSVRPDAVYRLPIDRTKADPKFLAHILNGPFGRAARELNAAGATIRRLTKGAVLALELPIPSLDTQKQIIAASANLSDLRSQLDQMSGRLEGDWTDVSELQSEVAQVRAVFDLEARLNAWADELPYPLATVHRAFAVADDPREKLEAALHFFEITAVYLACVSASHARDLRSDGRELLKKWLFPSGGATIKRTDFGFWTGVAGASSRSLKQLAGDASQREQAIERGDLELLYLAEKLGGLSAAIPSLEAAKRIRNDWKGHGGHIKASDAEDLVCQLSDEMRHLHQASAALLRDLKLIRPGPMEVRQGSLFVPIEDLTGSDPKFHKIKIELSRPIETGKLAFWNHGYSRACETLPFIQLGKPISPDDTCAYVYSRVEGDKVRWISFQAAREQEVLADVNGLEGLLDEVGDNSA